MHSATISPEPADLAPRSVPPKGLTIALYRVELLICFTPVALLLGFGCVFWLGAAVEVFKSGSVDTNLLFTFSLIAAFNFAGIFGLTALYSVVRFIEKPTLNARATNVTRFGVIIGLIPIIVLASPGVWPLSLLLGWLPILASTHLIYLAREYLL